LSPSGGEEAAKQKELPLFHMLYVQIKKAIALNFLSSPAAATTKHDA